MLLRTQESKSWYHIAQLSPLVPNISSSFQLQACVACQHLGVGSTVDLSYSEPLVILPEH